ncbi:MAG: 4Fe-4S dicluster domain-containing protein [Bacteroidia bacterium]|jgi:ferredoxin|nr:4Fe-4S dicluster domain-containing protein [Bacteroidia bacterium]GIV22670.1 MAG: ferredoxin [Bacteroidia bacterium]
MAIRITDDCINCGACEPECPNNAIYEGGVQWRYKDGTHLSGQILLPNGLSLDAEAAHPPIATEYYYIVPSKCTECTGFHEEPQCAAVCPVDCCLPDPDHVETPAQLLAKKAFLHDNQPPAPDIIQVYLEDLERA